MSKKFIFRPIEESIYGWLEFKDEAEMFKYIINKLNIPESYILKRQIGYDKDYICHEDIFGWKDVRRVCIKVEDEKQDVGYCSHDYGQYDFVPIRKSDESPLTAFKYVSSSEFGGMCVEIIMAKDKLEASQISGYCITPDKIEEIQFENGKYTHQIYY